MEVRNHHITWIARRKEEREMKHRVLIYEGETGEILQDVQIYNQLFDDLPVKKIVTFLNTLRKDHTPGKKEKVE